MQSGFNTGEHLETLQSGPTFARGGRVKLQGFDHIVAQSDNFVLVGGLTQILLVAGPFAFLGFRFLDNSVELLVKLSSATCIGLAVRYLNTASKASVTYAPLELIQVPFRVLAAAEALSW